MLGPVRVIEIKYVPRRGEHRPAQGDHQQQPEIPPGPGGAPVPAQQRVETGRQEQRQRQPGPPVEPAQQPDEQGQGEVEDGEPVQYWQGRPGG